MSSLTSCDRQHSFVCCAALENIWVGCLALRCFLGVHGGKKIQFFFQETSGCALTSEEMVAWRDNLFFPLSRCLAGKRKAELVKHAGCRHETAPANWGEDVASCWFISPTLALFPPRSCFGSSWSAAQLWYHLGTPDPYKSEALGALEIFPHADHCSAVKVSQHLILCCSNDAWFLVHGKPSDSC